MAASSFCPRFHKAVELIGGRWTGAILRALLGGRVRYKQLRDAVPDISDRMLSERLRELEAEGIVTRSVIPEPPIRVEYSLTEKGRALEPSLDAISRWADDWVPADSVASEPAIARRRGQRPGTGQARRSRGRAGTASSAVRRRDTRSR